MKRAYIFLTLIGGLFLGLAIIFMFFPRPSFSEVAVSYTHLTLPTNSRV